jgi:hypothetical protein
MFLRWADAFQMWTGLIFKVCYSYPVMGGVYVNCASFSFYPFLIPECRNKEMHLTRMDFPYTCHYILFLYGTRKTKTSTILYAFFPDTGCI